MSRNQLSFPLLVISVVLSTCLVGDSYAQSSSNSRLRGNLNHSLATFAKQLRGRVAFIGGSITEMEGYRPMVADYLKQRFPDTRFEFTNAGISSTCSTTGAFRLARDVLAVKPDLVFVEFAVNDDQDASHSARECVRGMEGIVRQLRLHDPSIDIVVTHFTNPGMLEKAQRGEQSTSCSSHEHVAQHYEVSSIDVSAELADQIKAGKMTWKQYGGTHPKPAGNRLVADSISNLLEAAWSNPIVDAPATPRRLPAVLDANSYFRGRLLATNQAKLRDGWAIETPDWDLLPGSKRARFNQLKLLCSTTPGAESDLDFSGTAIGAYVLAGPDAGQLEVSIDGGAFQIAELYHRHSRGLHYPRTVIFAADLENKSHQLKLRIAKSHHADSQGTAARIMHFVVNGSVN